MTVGSLPEAKKPFQPAKRLLSPPQSICFAAREIALADEMTLATPITVKSPEDCTERSDHQGPCLGTGIIRSSLDDGSRASEDAVEKEQTLFLLACRHP